MCVGLEDRPAPTELELVRRFVNTREIDEHIELLPTAPAARRRRHDTLTLRTGQSLYRFVVPRPVRGS